jgi:hypothetical protein
MAPFVSQQLIQHLVTSNPSAAYIQRISQVFENDGAGVKGNLRAVIQAILTDAEARAGDSLSAPTNANFGHLREPILLMANLLRGLNATVSAPDAVAATATNMSEELFYAPSVFSYFSPQSRTEKGLYGPEFQIYSTQTAADRADAVNTLIYGTLGGVKLNLAPFGAAAGSTTSLASYIASVFLHSSMSSELQNAVASAVAAVSTPTEKAQAALYVVLTSSEYQVIQ